jgi:CubicO group peptidase (beta-lactamase class C family)
VSAVAIVLMISLVSVSGCGGSTANTYSKTMQEMTTYINKQIADGKVKGLAVVLIDDQTTVWLEGFGKADVVNEIPATPDTHFEIGSNSKTFAGVMIAQLVEQGFNIDEPVTKYLPGFKISAPLGFAAGNPITIRTMLTHHSGIPGDMFNGGFALKSKPHKTRKEMNQWFLDYLANDYQAFPVDLVASYSNTAVALLSDVIANASGKDFADYSEALFYMLGMDQTSFDHDSPKVAANVSKGYISGIESGPFYCSLGTSGSIISTARDMAKYLKMITGNGMGERGRVMSAAVLETMLTNQSTSPPLDLGAKIGFLWQLTDQELSYAGNLCWHNGSTMTMTSHMIVLRDHKLAVVVLSNTSEAGSVVGNIARQTLKLALEEKTGITPPAPFVPPYSPPATWSQATLDQLSGIYVKSDTTGGYLKISSVSGGLEWTDADATIKVIPRENGWLSAADSQTTQYQFIVVSGRSVMLGDKENKTKVVAEKYSPTTIPDAWKARTGVWDAYDLDPADSLLYMPGAGNPSTEIKITDGILMFNILPAGSGGTFIIQPVDNTRSYLRGLGRNMGTAAQIFTVDGKEALQFLGIRYRKR